MIEKIRFLLQACDGVTFLKAILLPSCLLRVFQHLPPGYKKQNLNQNRESRFSFGARTLDAEQLQNGVRKLEKQNNSISLTQHT